MGLTQASSKLCTFITPWGRFRFVRMPFGLVNASDEFQRLTDNMFAGMDGVCVVVDDILVWGSTKEQHDARLSEVLRRCVRSGLVLNRSKCKIAQASVKYLGVVLDSEGISIDPGRISDTQAVKPPRKLSELQGFLGMTNFVSSFVDSYTDITAPLRVLLKKDTVFIWGDAQQRAFDSLKRALATAPVLRYFDPDSPLVLSVDSSQFAVGAVLLQGQQGARQPIAYASRTFTRTQQGYAQIEKEMLAIVFGCKKFHYYVYEQRRLRVETDHKPLEMIMRKPLHQVPLRLKRVRLTIQRYDIDAQYVPGKHMYVADYLSRNPRLYSTTCQQ